MKWYNNCEGNIGKGMWKEEMMIHFKELYLHMTSKTDKTKECLSLDK